jgi:predicted RNA-binding Zn-ribbon protein involved in translation (DUF1610 family)
MFDDSQDSPIPERLTNRQNWLQKSKCRPLFIAICCRLFGLRRTIKHAYIDEKIGYLCDKDIQLLQLVKVIARSRRGRFLETDHVSFQKRCHRYIRYPSLLQPLSILLSSYTCILSVHLVKLMSLFRTCHYTCTNCGTPRIYKCYDMHSKSGTYQCKVSYD